MEAALFLVIAACIATESAVGSGPPVAPVDTSTDTHAGRGDGDGDGDSVSRPEPIAADRYEKVRAALHDEIRSIGWRFERYESADGGATLRDLRTRFGDGLEAYGTWYVEDGRINLLRFDSSGSAADFVERTWRPAAAFFRFHETVVEVATRDPSKRAVVGAIVEPSAAMTHLGDLVRIGVRFSSFDLFPISALPSAASALGDDAVTVRWLINAKMVVGGTSVQLNALTRMGEAITMETGDLFRRIGVPSARLLTAGDAVFEVVASDADRARLGGLVSLADPGAAALCAVARRRHVALRGLDARPEGPAVLPCARAGGAGLVLSVEATTPLGEAVLWTGLSVPGACVLPDQMRLISSDSSGVGDVLIEKETGSLDFLTREVQAGVGTH